MAFLGNQIKSSTLNSTTTPLASGATWTGEWEIANGYPSTAIAIISDTDGTYYAQYSDNGSDITVSIPYTISSGSNDVHRLVNFWKYHRGRFVNSNSTQNRFTVQTRYGDFEVPSIGLSSPLTTDWDTLAVRSINVGQDPNGSYVNQKVGGYAFQTQQTLNSGQSYTSSLLNMSGYTQIINEIYSDKNGTLVGKWYSDANETNLVREFSVPYIATNGLFHGSAPVFSPYLRYFFLNNSGENQTEFHFALRLTNTAQSGQVLNVDAPIISSMVANLGRTVLVGQNQAGNFINSTVDQHGDLKVHIHEPKTSFGHLAVDELEPMINLSYPYNINSRLVNTGSNGTANVFQTQSMAVVSTGTTPGSSGSLESRQLVKYRPGQGITTRFTAVFQTGSADELSLIGYGNHQDGLFFGVSGSQIGILHINDYVEEWIPQSSWNGDKMDGTLSSTNPTGQNLDPTKGNVYEIAMQYLGFGDIKFKIEDKYEGNFVEVHNLKYANTYDKPSLSNASLPFSMRVHNNTSTSDVRIKNASVGIFNEGNVKILGYRNSYSRAVAASSGDVHMFTIRNRSSFHSKINRNNLLLELISLISDGNATVNFKFLRNATIGGSPSWTNIETNTSIAEVDTAGTISGGTQIFAIGMGKIDSKLQTLKDFEISLSPGETMSIVMNAGGANAGTQATLTWREDL